MLQFFDTADFNIVDLMLAKVAFFIVLTVAFEVALDRSLCGLGLWEALGAGRGCENKDEGYKKRIYEIVVARHFE